MEHTISHDALGTHIDWQHEGVTAREIDWFWSNMGRNPYTDLSVDGRGRDARYRYIRPAPAS